MAENDMREYYLFAIKAMADITGTILLPGLLVVFLSSLYQDLAYAEIISLISLAVVFVLSMIMVVKKVQRYGEEYKKLTDTKPPSSGGSSSS